MKAASALDQLQQSDYAAEGHGHLTVVVSYAANVYLSLHVTIGTDTASPGSGQSSAMRMRLRRGRAHATRVGHAPGGQGPAV